MLDHLKEKPDFHYLRLANELESKIMGGEYAAGDRLPSLRKLHKQLNLILIRFQVETNYSKATGMVSFFILTLGIFYFF